MKTNITFFVFVLLANVSFAEYTDRVTFSMITSLAQQVRLCDMAGSGTVVESSATNIKLTVTEYWLGNPGTNSLNITTDMEDMEVATMHSNIVFFAVTNQHFRAKTINELSAAYVWEYALQRPSNLPVIPPTFFGGSRAWFYTTESSGELLSLATNLIVQCRTSPNMEGFYDLIRLEGKIDSRNRVEAEKFYSLWACISYGESNFVSLVANDPKAFPYFRNNALWRINNNMEYLHERGSR